MGSHTLTHVVSNPPIHAELPHIKKSWRRKKLDDEETLVCYQNANKLLLLIKNSLSRMTA